MAGDGRFTELAGVELPIVQAPMAGANGAAMAAAVSAAGGLGSLPCAMLNPEKMRAEIAAIRALTNKPFNVNFFCHRNPEPDEAAQARWKERLRPYYEELGVDFDAPVPAASRAPFDDAACSVIEETRPAVVSFHFGLPAPELVERVRAAGCKIVGCATTVAEAVWLERRGVDAIVAQGAEAGGHRGLFLGEDGEPVGPGACPPVHAQPGTMALVPQVADAVSVPVIAAGGIADGRGIAAALVLGASAVQIGTAYLFADEATISPAHREALRAGRDDGTALTNLFSGRPARGIQGRLTRELGAINPDAAPFPTASGALSPLKAAGGADFAPMWSGQAAGLSAKRAGSAGGITRALAEEAKRSLRER